MRPNDDVNGQQHPGLTAAAAGDGSVALTQSEHEGRILDRFPEAVAAGAISDGPERHLSGSAVGYRVLLYSALAIGAVTGLSLIAAWVLQAVLTGSYIHAGGDYFSAGLEATAARELLSIPVDGFVVVLLLCFVGLCVGAWGTQKSSNLKPPAV